MSRSSERPWTEEEKVYLLTEILRVSQLPSSEVLELIERTSTAPKWNDIPLPPGRSLRSCQNVYTEMRHSRRPAVAPPPPGGYQSYPPTSPYVQHPLLPQLQPSQPPTRKRPFQDIEGTAFIPTSRVLQPRPSVSAQAQSPFSTFSGEFPSAGVQSPSDTGDEPRKKRGRPTKDELQRRHEEAAARGEVYQPKRRAPRKSTEVTSQPTAAETTLSPTKPESARISTQSSPQTQQSAPGEAVSEHRTEPPSCDPMEASSPLRPPPAAPPSSGPDPMASSENRVFAPYPPNFHEPPHFTHRPAQVTSTTIPRYQPPPLLAPAHPPLQTSSESNSSGMPSSYSTLYDNPAPSRP